MITIQDLSHAEKQILVKILRSKKNEITESQIEAESTKQKLSTMNLITYVPKKGRQRQGRYKLTMLGRDVAQKVAEDWAPPPKLTIEYLKQEMDSKFQHQSIKLEEMLHRLDMIERTLEITDDGPITEISLMLHRLDVIERTLEITDDGPASKVASKIPLDEAELPKVLKEFYAEICSKESHFSSLIPLWALKQKLYEKYDLSDDVVNQTLLNLEKARIIDLQIAYDIGSLIGAEYGIEIPGRGLVFYVRWRRQ